MKIIERLQNSTSQRWTGIYLRVLAAVLLYGASVHVGNLLGVTGMPWRETPIHWQVMDVLLLVFDVVVAVGLWFKLAWAAIAFILGIISLQIIPYTVFRQYFIAVPEDVFTLNGLIVTELVLIAILLAGMLKCNGQ